MIIKDKLTLQLPLLQAPLTGYPNQAEFVAKVSEYGAMGIYSTDCQSLVNIKKDIKSIQKNTQQNFAVLINLTETDDKIDLADRSSTNTYLTKAYQVLAIEPTEAPAFPDVNAVCKAVVELKPPVLIFQNGIPTDAFIEHCQRSGIIILAFASNTLEAMTIDSTQIDGIILQGLESASLQSQFENDLNTTHYPINTLLHHAQANTKKPIIAWGDDQTTKAVVATMEKGAKAVVLDTPFWLLDESPIPDSYRQALNEHNEMCTTISSIWLGQPARVLQNELTRQTEKNNGTVLAPGKQRRLLKPIIDAAIAQDNPDYLPLWAGLCAKGTEENLDDFCKTFKAALSPILNKD